jgi:hypothetical protein
MCDGASLPAMISPDALAMEREGASRRRSSVPISPDLVGGEKPLSGDGRR